MPVENDRDYLIGLHKMSRAGIEKAYLFKHTMGADSWLSIRHEETISSEIPVTGPYPRYELLLITEGYTRLEAYLKMKELVLKIQTARLLPSEEFIPPPSNVSRS